MTKAKAPLKLIAFDAARYLDDDEAIAEYMTTVLEAGDPDLLLLALGDVARAKGMAQVARDAGPGAGELVQGPCARREASLRNRHEGRSCLERQVHRTARLSVVSASAVGPDA